MMPFAVLGLVLWMRRRRETRFVPVPIPVPIQ
jgi:uncharacterized iron-regulated membrane protein